MGMCPAWLERQGCVQKMTQKLLELESEGTGCCPKALGDEKISNPRSPQMTCPCLYLRKESYRNCSRKKLSIMATLHWRKGETDGLKN